MTLWYSAGTFLMIVQRVLKSTIDYRHRRFSLLYNAWSTSMLFINELCMWIKWQLRGFSYFLLYSAILFVWIAVRVWEPFLKCIMSTCAIPSNPWIFSLTSNRHPFSNRPGQKLILSILCPGYPDGYPTVYDSSVCTSLDSVS